MKISDETIKISNWLRFERKMDGPCFISDIEKAVGIKLTPSLIMEGQRTGLFLYSNAHNSFI